ncbi:hypothetical protein AWB75_06910 [Caballeronia catudaia]|uniref:Uncharacterized protein n=1 Tax=Caballeronia catudaia TaxID=1777136 RepID=A0A158DMF6_9BURK|nr:hypothetical protein AWB75_06910 [Caballeronia catudaia]
MARSYLPLNRRLCVNAAEEWTVVPSTSYTPVQPDSELPSERGIASSPASTSLPVLASLDVDLQHTPDRLINHHSEGAGRLGPLRGFLPRGLFNACPHALSLAREPLIEGRRRTNLNGENKPKRGTNLNGFGRSPAQTASGRVTGIRERSLWSRLYRAARLFWASYASWSSLLRAGRCFSSTRCPSLQR